MNSAEQAAGERRVKQLLIEPLERLGLTKPSNLTLAKFDDMIDELCSKLAYMKELNLQALAEQVAAMPGGKDKDRFPIAAKILGWAVAIQQPADDVSPFIRAVFAHSIGRQAMAENWAPELLSFIRKNRGVWPTEFDLRAIKERAANARNQIAAQNDVVRNGGSLSESDQRFRDMRQAAADKCQRIADLVNSEAVA